MDAQEMEDWCRFCEGKEEFDTYHFSRMFMEMYLEPLTEKDKADLHTVFGYVPNSSRALEKMLRLDGCAPDKSESEIIETVRADLAQMRRVIKSEHLLRAMDSPIVMATGEEELCKSWQGSINDEYRGEVLNYVLDHFGTDKKVDALHEAFYGLASNMHLQHALTANLLNLDVSFDHYFELYRIGVDYALEERRVVVMNYRALYSP